RATGTVRELRGRSEHRILEVTWAGRTPAWAPRGGRPLTPRADGATRFELPAPVDVAAVVAEASAVAEVVGVRCEPPGLEDVFLELVG
ncbi:MAG: hypothetical protein KDB21_19525, partial [Acidimicrobiales bacterium]|nr:hypothetical protein [Acidimicrobiales bacterium]